MVCEFEDGEDELTEGELAEQELAEQESAEQESAEQELVEEEQRSGEECEYVACVPKWIRMFSCTVDMIIKWVKLNGWSGHFELEDC